MICIMHQLHQDANGTTFLSSLMCLYDITLVLRALHTFKAKELGRLKKTLLECERVWENRR